MKKDGLEKILQQRLTRKEFLQYIGSGLLVLFGVSNLLKALQSPTKKGGSGAGSSYGSSAYGGGRK